MGNQKLKWTTDEEEALRAGVNKHGIGKWKNILKDPEFAPFLTSRSNIDLKDKWRNMSISTGLITKDKSKGPRVKPITAGVITIGEGSSAAAVIQDESFDVSKNPQYNAMIFHALSIMNAPMGSDIGSIVNFIEQVYEVPQNFKRLLGPKLRRLVLQGKLERVGNGYKIKSAAPRTQTPVVNPRGFWTGASHMPGPGIYIETVADASKTAAYKVAVAENKSFVAAVAANEAERVLSLAEETESIVQVVREIQDDCLRGAKYLLAC